MDSEQELNNRMIEFAGINLVGVPRGCEPKFTQSLDACFKWLVPKIDFGQMELYLLEDSTWLWHLNYVGRNDVGFSGRGETPALALCKAIDKLISEKKDERKLS